MSKGPYRFLFVNLPFGGHLNPVTDLAEKLIDAGHRVTFVMAEEMRETIEQTGADFVPYDDYDSNQGEMRRYLSAFQSAYQTAKQIGKDYDCLVYEMLFVFGSRLACDESPCFGPSYRYCWLTFVYLLASPPCAPVDDWALQAY